MKIKDVYMFLDSIAPFDTAEEWDNCGLAVGSLENDVTKILVALDVTDGVVDDALKCGAQLVITHHPLIFTPVSDIQADSLLYKAVKSGVTFISSHTCLDKADGGVNDCLAEKVGLKNVRHSGVDDFLKIGETQPCTAREFAENIKKSLGGCVSYTQSEKVISRVAFCSGAGGDLVKAAAEVGADALLTGEAHHHEYLEARQCGISLFAAGHYETEVCVCEYLKKVLDTRFADIETVIYKHDSPVNFI